MRNRVALTAVAWVFVFEGCRSGRLGVVGLGFVAAALAGCQGAQVFVANAFLVWVFPAIFARGVRSRWRAAWLAFAVATFLAAVQVAGSTRASPPCAASTGPA